MVKINITVDASAYKNISEKLPEIKRKGLSLTGQEMLRNLGLNSPVDHGLLRQSNPKRVKHYDSFLVKNGLALSAKMDMSI